MSSDTMTQGRFWASPLPTIAATRWTFTRSIGIKGSLQGHFGNVSSVARGGCLLATDIEYFQLLGNQETAIVS